MLPLGQEEQVLVQGQGRAQEQGQELGHQQGRLPARLLRGLIHFVAAFLLHRWSLL